MDPVVRVTGLTQGYGARTVIEGLDLDLGVGAFGLLGPNGAGKTTLLRTLATIAPPGAGSLEILGRRITSERSARRARREIGFLPQDFGHHPGFTVHDFVAYCAWLREVPARQVHRDSLRVIEQVGLADRRNERMKALSGGMLRRAGIASALVGSPRLVLLDEPTVGLDPAQRLEFRELIRSLAEDTAVVLSTHLVEDVSAVCREVAVMAAGRFVFRGTPAEMTALASPGTQGDTALERGYISVLGAGR
ncbi:ATP-binding cassette domain-containing protein [Kitasatospora sp. NPDC094015]|uniref:ATP-binding cassette domain-containing protein n=1 Tax=Kitasatospora sp. NPDC094015 TaxID=3155205 RepID=UPI00331655D5